MTEEEFVEEVFTLCCAGLALATGVSPDETTKRIIEVTIETSWETAHRYFKMEEK